MTEEKLKKIAYFQYATLDLSIEKMKFEIKWLKTFIDNMKADNIID